MREQWSQLQAEGFLALKKLAQVPVNRAKLLVDCVELLRV